MLKVNFFLLFRSRKGYMVGVADFSMVKKKD